MIKLIHEVVVESVEELLDLADLVFEGFDVEGETQGAGWLFGAAEDA